MNVEIRVRAGTTFATATDWDALREQVARRYVPSTHVPDAGDERALAAAVEAGTVGRLLRTLREGARQLHLTRRHRDKLPRGRERLLRDAALRRDPPTRWDFLVRDAPPEVQPLLTDMIERQHAYATRREQ